MWFILPLIGLMFVADVWWWRRGDRALRRTGRRGVWRGAWGLWMGLMFAGLATVMAARMYRATDRLPALPMTLIYVWHFMVPLLFVLPTAVWDALRGAVRGTQHLLRRGHRQGFEVASRSTAIVEAPAAPSRRAFLQTALVAAPPLFTIGLTGRSMAEINSFRVRKLIVRLPALPAALEGMTIAHVADTHVGAFTTTAKLRKVADAVNNLRCDVILQTGDLINSALADLPDGIDFLNRLDAPGGVWSVEGNHDLIENRWEFDRLMKLAGQKLLLNESTVVRVRGEPLQLLGLRWGRQRQPGEQSQPGDRGDEAIAASMQDLLITRDPARFGILMAHHPHAFDPAAAAGIPLTLSGHTHGGQLALTERFGFGPMMYRYWSGLYGQGDSACVVSNGVGNWFPVRVNVPAELLHLTLTRG